MSEVEVSKDAVMNQSCDWLLSSPSILLRTALCRSGFCSASRFLSSLAQTMKAFMGLRIRCSPPAAFPSPPPSPCPPAPVPRDILVSGLLMVPPPRPSGELQSPERFWSKPISESEAGLGVRDAQGPPADPWPACSRVSVDRLGSDKFIPEAGSGSALSPGEIQQTSAGLGPSEKFWK